MNKKLQTTLKLVVSVATLFIVFNSIDPQGLYDVSTTIDYWTVCVALLFFWIAQLISSLRCAYIARELGSVLPLPASIKAHFIGLWFNQVLPTSLGGDVLKMGILRRYMSVGSAVSTAILDRFSGLFILMLVVLITLPIYKNVLPSNLHDPINVLGLAALLFISGTLASAWVGNKLSLKYIDNVYVRNTTRYLADLWRFRRGMALWRQLWTSTYVHFSGIAVYAILSYALGQQISFLIFVLMVPLVFLVALLPVSFAGWGLREIGAVWLFGMVGVSKEASLILSVSYGLFLIVASIPGLFLLHYKDRS